MKKLIGLLLTGACFVNTYACLNDKHTENKEKHFAHDVMPIFYDSLDKNAAITFLGKYDIDNITQYDKETQSNIAVSLIYIGSYNDALQILRRLQKSNPQDYTITARLGSAYEFMGKNDSALLFIKKSIELDPDAYLRSEWAHTRILEAKIELQKNKTALSYSRVLELYPYTIEESQKYVPGVLRVLEERVPFASKPDIILADIFAKLGDNYAHIKFNELAYISYQFSSHFSYKDIYDISYKINRLNRIFRDKNIQQPYWKTHYMSRSQHRTYDKLETKPTKAEIEEARKQAEKMQKFVAEFQDELSGEKKKREDRQKKKLYIAGALLVVIAILGFILYRQTRKK